VSLVKFGSRASAVVVAAVAGYSSWQHIVEVAQDAGERLSVAGVMPLSIDGLVVVASLAMLEDKRSGCQPRLSARVALGFGILATLGFNLASAEPTWTARAVAAVPAISFLLAVEVLSRTGKRVSAMADTVTEVSKINTLEDGVTTSSKLEDFSPPPGKSLVADVPADAGTVPAVWVGSGSNAERVRLVAGRLPQTASLAEIAAAAGCSERTAGRYLPDGHPAKPGKAKPAESPNGRQVVKDSTT